MRLIPPPHRAYDLIDFLAPLKGTVESDEFWGLGFVARNEFLSHDYLFATGWNSTRFNAWSWPYRLSAISNLPALFAGLLFTIPISAMEPTLSETLQLAPMLVFVFLLWLWVGPRFDRRWSAADRTPMDRDIPFRGPLFCRSVSAAGLYRGFNPTGEPSCRDECDADHRHGSLLRT